MKILWESRFNWDAVRKKYDIVPRTKALKPDLNKCLINVYFHPYLPQSSSFLSHSCCNSALSLSVNKIEQVGLTLTAASSSDDSLNIIESKIHRHWRKTSRHWPGNFGRGANCWSKVTQKWFSAGIYNGKKIRNSLHSSEGFIWEFSLLFHILKNPHLLRLHQAQWAKIVHVIQWVINRVFLIPKKSVKDDRLIQKVGITA